VAVAASVATFGLVPSAATAQAPDRAARWDTSWQPPRTEWGHPDLQGNWTNATLTPFEREDGVVVRALSWAEVDRLEGRAASAVVAGSEPSDPDRPPPEVANDPGTYNQVWFDRGMRVSVVDGEPRSSMITFPSNGRIPPLTAEGARRQAEYRAFRSQFEPYDHPEIRPMQERCVIYGSSFGARRPSRLGPPMIPTGGYNHNYTIVQNADHVLIMAEMIHDVRIIRLGEPRPLPDDVRPYFGDSWGRWAGDTLVVETMNISPEQRYYIHSPELVVVERFNRVDDDTILYEFEVRDPDTYSEPWGGQLPLEQFDDLLYEYSCHEGNYALANVLSGARYQERAAREPTEPR
jgi:hypothetical protein